MDHIDDELYCVYQGCANQTDNHAYQRRHCGEQFVYSEAHNISQQRLNMIHSEVYDLSNQPFHRFDNRYHCPEGGSQVVDTENTLSAQALLDVLQVFQRECIAHRISDVACNIVDFTRKSIKHCQSLFAEHVPDDLADVLKVISQQTDHCDDSTDSGNHRAEGAEQSHKCTAQFTGYRAYRRVG